MPYLTMELELDDEPIKVDVAFNAFPASRGMRERGTGLPLEPDEPADVELVSVHTQGKPPIDITPLLSKKQISAIEDRLCEMEGEPA